MTKKIILNMPNDTITLESEKELTASDGYHTFDELYEHRILLFLLAFKSGALKVGHVVENHFEGWDLLVSYTPGQYNQISYHVPVSYRWAYKEAPRWTKEQQEKFYDGHDSTTVAQRLKIIIKKGNI